MEQVRRSLPIFPLKYNECNDPPESSNPFALQKYIWRYYSAGMYRASCACSNWTRNPDEVKPAKDYYSESEGFVVVSRTSTGKKSLVRLNRMPRLCKSLEEFIKGL